jgi:hypothetical protein
MKKKTLDSIQKLLDRDSLEIVEVANMGNWLEARIHSAFTNITDDMFGGGYLTRAERISLSAAFGLALGAFNVHVEEEIPQLYDRRPYQEAPEPADGDIEAVEKKPKESEVKDVDDLETDFVPLLEKAVRSDGTIPIKIIEPGWGASGYYSPEVLQRDGPEVFTEGIKLYWNHPTLTEDAERPERDLHDLAAELIAAARWVPDHPSGAGLYGDAKVFKPFQDAVDELAPHIGVSIRAKGKVVHGQAEGQSGPIVQEITVAKSVDFVTEPGAGGQILQLFEAQRKVVRDSNSEKERKMDEKELKELKDSNVQLEKEAEAQKKNMALLSKQLLEREAGDFVADALVKIEGLPQTVRARLLRDLVKDVPVKEGKVDEVAYGEMIKKAVQAELTYLSEVTGKGDISGMGSGGSEELTDEQAGKALEKAFARMGLEESTAKIAAAGR